MASDYAPRIVLLGYYQEYQDQGTKEQRQTFSDTLHNLYNTDIVELGKKANVPVGVEERSIMAVLARMSSGSENRTRAEKGVRAYRQFLGV